MTTYRTITDDEAESWAKSLDQDNLIQILKEYDVLRNTVCERVMGVVTGTDNWLERSVCKAMTLVNSERAFRTTIAKMQMISSEAEAVERETRCGNCWGTGRTRNSRCSVCRGTGMRYN